MEQDKQTSGQSRKKQQDGLAPVSGVHPQDQPIPYESQSFADTGVLDAWERYADQLTWGKGQCLAILDDGCDLTVPEWQVLLPWGPKVIATYNSIDDNDDPTPVPPGYHGTSVGYPSSLYYRGLRGVAYHNHVAQIRCASIVHLRQDESPTIAGALQWVIDHAPTYQITAVNLSVLDDQEHREPVRTVIDPLLERLRAMNIWVSAPCGNNGYIHGISWPACQPGCFAIGAVMPGTGAVHLDRSERTDILVPAAATSSSNAIIAACSMILREAMEIAGFNWGQYGDTLPAAMLALCQLYGRKVRDPDSDRSFHQLNLLPVLQAILG